MALSASQSNRVLARLLQFFSTVLIFITYVLFTKNRRYLLPMKSGKVPLERALSKLGLASRTQTAAWIREGRLKVNGVVRKNVEFLVTPETARFELDGNPLTRPEWQAIAFYKPKHCVTTHSDEKGRKTVYDFLPKEFGFLHSIGRLDWATTGLLILTNDSRLSSFMTDPENAVLRTYLVSVRGEVTEKDLAQIRSGIQDEGEWLRVDSVKLQKSSSRESHLEICLKEGKNREIRRIFDSLNHEVVRLKRVSYGDIELETLHPGEFRKLTRKDFKQGSA